MTKDEYLSVMRVGTAKKHTPGRAGLKPARNADTQIPEGEMPTIEELKAKVQAAIDERSDWLVNISKTILDNPEPGFHEFKTAALVSDRLSELGIGHQTGIALTASRACSRAGGPGPTVGGDRRTGLAARARPRPRRPGDGRGARLRHHCQIGMMMGAAVGLMVPEVIESLAGNVALIAVPAEEFIDVEYRWGCTKRASWA